MKLDLNYQIKDLSGKEIQDDGANAGKALAGALSNSNKGNAVKIIDWSLKLWRKETIEIDKIDKEFLEGFVETTELLTNLGKQSILNSIKEQYEKE